MSKEYDADNIFAKIVDGKAEAFKIFESKSALAFLDAFPMVEGHTLFVPKAKGYSSFLDMPPIKASEYLRDLQKVAKAVKEATGATGINIWQNNGADAGQVVFHPHFHIVPRKEGDNLHKYPPSGSKITEDAAQPIVKKIQTCLNPPRPLKKAKFGKISSIKPDSKGLNLHVKVLGTPTEVESKGGKFYEVLCGDASGTIILSLREDQKSVAGDGKTIDIRNGGVKMVKGHVRLAVDKWGKVDATDEDTEFEVEKAEAKNVSSVEYELVAH